MYWFHTIFRINSGFVTKEHKAADFCFKDDCRMGCFAVESGRHGDDEGSEHL